MRIVGLLSWWEESPAWLTRCVSSLGFLDHLVAVDGAYAHAVGSLRYARSGGEQVDAITAACDGLGIGLTLHRPAEAWLGDEVAKRSFMFRAGMLAAAAGEDWFYVVDADEVVTEVPANLRKQLAAAADDGLEVGAVDWFERTSNQPLPGEDRSVDVFWQALTLRSEQTGMRKFFQADPTLRVERAHYVYVAGPAEEPRYLWGHPFLHEIEPALPVDGFRFEHWSRLRQPARRKVALDYYAVRDRLELESLRPPEFDGVPEVARV